MVWLPMYNICWPIWGFSHVRTFPFFRSRILAIVRVRPLFWRMYCSYPLFCHESTVNLLQRLKGIVKPCVPLLAIVRSEGYTSCLIDRDIWFSIQWNRLLRALCAREIVVGIEFKFVAAYVRDCQPNVWWIFSFLTPVSFNSSRFVAQVGFLVLATYICWQLFNFLPMSATIK